ncbi:MAG TPA: DUF4157 domain-containing protein [Pyrinomonadaceae bacterium]|nr:DUF4157 domain-containing protein [Pyrinomonadaceae bacterium]
MKKRSTAQRKQQQSVTPVAAPVLQRKCACGNQAMSGGECSECQKKNHELQRKAVDSDKSTAIPPIVDEVLSSTGQPLQESTRTLMEPRFGHDFSGVRVHTDARAGESAQEVNAHAYTMGQDVVFAPGRYQPSTESGQALIAHELSHVMQQEGVSGQPARAISDPADSSEHEADAVAGSVLRNEPVAVNQAPSAAIQTLSTEEGLGIAGGVLGGAAVLGGIGVGIAALAGAFDKEDFSDTELKTYLELLKTSKKIEGNRDSDNKARDVVRKKLHKDKDVFVRGLLVDEMLTGVTGDDDEDAILKILTDASPKDRQSIAFQVSYERLYNKIDGEQLDALYALMPEFKSLYPRGKEERTTHNINDYIARWEKEHGHTLTDDEKRTLGRGCVGVTALTMEDLNNPDLTNCYDTFAQVWDGARKMNDILAAERPDKKAIIFSKRFWSGGKEYKPDPKTGKVDLSEHEDEPRPSTPTYDPINFDYGLYDEKTGHWWHANHCDWPLSGDLDCSHFHGRMEVYESNIQSYSHPLFDFDRQVFCVAVGNR